MLSLAVGFGLFQSPGTVGADAFQFQTMLHDGESGLPIDELLDLDHGAIQVHRPMTDLTGQRVHVIVFFQDIIIFFLTEIEFIQNIDTLQQFQGPIDSGQIDVSLASASSRMASAFIP